MERNSLEDFFKKLEDLEQDIQNDRSALKSTMDQIKKELKEIENKEESISVCQNIIKTLKASDRFLRVADVKNDTERLEKDYQIMKKNIEDLNYALSEKQEEMERAHKIRTEALEYEVKYKDEEMQELKKQFEIRKLELYHEIQKKQISAFAEREMSDRDDFKELNELKRKLRENNNEIGELRAKLADVKKQINNHRSAEEQTTDDNDNGSNFIGLNIDIDE